MQHNITYRQKDKGWQYIISYKENEKWKQKSKQGFETRKKASLAAVEHVKALEKTVELAEQLDSGYADITFGDFAGRLIEHEKLYKEANTIASLSLAVRRFEGLLNVPIKDIKHVHIQNCVDKLVDDGLRISTIKLYISKIAYIFNQAVDPHNVLITSPVGKLKLPSLSSKEQTEKIKALTKTETDSLLKKMKAQNTVWYTLTLVAVTTGLRLGELMGLTWSDINFPTATIDVNKQWKLLHDQKYGFGKLKRKNSYRQVPIPAKTLSELKAYKKSTSCIDINNRIFPFELKECQKNTMRMFRDAGHNISIHDLRHTYATSLIANGIDFKTAANLLGHDVKMTMDTYSHVTDEMLKTAADKINVIF